MGSKASTPTKLIIDTDAGFDVDDVGAVCLGNALQDNGEAEIIAIGHTNGYVKGIGGVSALMEFWGRGTTVPLGAYKGAWARDPNAGKGTADKYLSDLDGNYPSFIKNSSQVPTPAEVYRKVLAAQPDGSVHIASIGIPTNMRDLVQSGPDKYSPLNGHDLIAQKVNMIVWMDMMYNFGCAQHDSADWLGPDTDCRGSAEAAVMGWPASVKQIFSPLGGDVKHGSWLTGCAGIGNPCRQAFEDWLGPSNGRSSWDPIAVMIAVRGAAGIHCKEVDQGGKNTVNEAGQEFWHDGQPGQSNQSRVVYDGAAQEAISFELNQLLCKPPGPWSDTVWAEAKGANCYGAHGATDLEHPASASCGVMTIAECQQKCLDLPGCTAITTSPADGGKVECYRKADISVRHCDSRTTFDTYVRHEWLLAGGFNCYPGHGADNRPAELPDPMTVRDCQHKCSLDTGCSAIVFQGKDHSGVGMCYLKANVDLTKCDEGSSFDTYLAGTTF
jgi:hypothetical protein